jgi:DNA-directed RNA polymerase subunit RPC12/RpoP
MKCSFCGAKFTSVDPDQKVCDDCKHAVEELSNGKGDDEDE